MIRYRSEISEDADINRSLRIGPLVVSWFTCHSLGGTVTQVWWRPDTANARCLWMRQWSAPAPAPVPI